MDGATWTAPIELIMDDQILGESTGPGPQYDNKRHRKGSRYALNHLLAARIRRKWGELSPAIRLIGGPVTYSVAVAAYWRGPLDEWTAVFGLLTAGAGLIWLWASAPLRPSERGQ